MIDESEAESVLEAKSVSTLESFATAVRFLTRIAVPFGLNASTEHYHAALRASVVFFPLVGGLIGLLTSSVVLVAWSWFSPPVCALLAIGIEALVTGAFHEDAFADTCDGLGGGWTREQVLEIMRDSRLGTYGTIGLVIGVGLRVAAIASLLSISLSWTVMSIVAAATLGRVAILAMMLTTSPITLRDSQARDVSGTQNWRTMLTALIITIPMWAVWVYHSPGVALSSMVAAMLVLVWFRRKVLSRVGGTTGDLLGCSAFITQLVILAGSSWCGQ
jgi:adenosylcobinamide-GDP ribazoletransferase